MTQTDTISASKQHDEIRPETKTFIEETFFQSLDVLNLQLMKLEREEITMKQFRSFILEQRVWFAERVVQYYHDLSLKATQMEHALLSIGRKLLEIHKM